MKSTTKETNVYVQPDCKVYQAQLQQVIATSGTVQTESLQEEEYKW